MRKYVLSYTHGDWVTSLAIDDARSGVWRRIGTRELKPREERGVALYLSEDEGNKVPDVLLYQIIYLDASAYHGCSREMGRLISAFINHVEELAVDFAGPSFKLDEFVAENAR